MWGRLLRSTSIKRSLTPSRNASGSSGHLTQLEGECRGSHQLMPLSLIPIQSVLLLTAQHVWEVHCCEMGFIWGNDGPSEGCTHQWALAAAAILEEKYKTDEPLLPASNVPAASTPPGATDTLVSTNAGKPGSSGQVKERIHQATFHHCEDPEVRVEGPQVTFHCHRSTIQGWTPVCPVPPGKSSWVTYANEEGTLADWGESAKWYWNRQSPPVAPAYYILGGLRGNCTW